jgi:hypothetical protein
MLPGESQIPEINTANYIRMKIVPFSPEYFRPKLPGFRRRFNPLMM